MQDTAYVKDAKGWKFAEDSRISKAQEKDIVSRAAYMLYVPVPSRKAQKLIKTGSTNESELRA